MPELSPELRKKIKSWTWIQSLALDVLNMLSEEQLSLTVGKNMGTLGQQLLHMARVRFQYAEAIESLRVAEMAEPIDRGLAASKAGLLAVWERANRRVISAVENAGDEAQINWEHWGLAEMNIHDHLNVLMDHETLHNGSLIVYLRSHELPFPESWKAWGL
jgi:uncharacterized damage-inducible protein DinB